MSERRPSPGPLTTLPVGAALLSLLAGLAVAQMPPEIPARPAVASPVDARPVEHVLEFGLGLGRYDFRGSDATSGFDSQYARYSRSRPRLDTWRLTVGRQHRLGDSSLDGGLSYTRFLGATGLTAGISSGTGDVLAHRYRLDLGIVQPVAGLLASLGYTRLESKAENSSHGWSLGLTRWFSHLIVSAGHRLEFGQPGDTESSTTSLGLMWYTWRKTYLGVGADFGQVAYQLVGPGVPVTGNVLVDYDSWSAHVALMRYLDERSGLNLRYDHGDARDIWTTDGVSASYFREW